MSENYHHLTWDERCRVLKLYRLEVIMKHVDLSTEFGEAVPQSGESTMSWANNLGARR